MHEKELLPYLESILIDQKITTISFVKPEEDIPAELPLVGMASYVKVFLAVRDWLALSIGKSDFATQADNEALALALAIRCEYAADAVVQQQARLMVDRIHAANAEIKKIPPVITNEDFDNAVDDVEAMAALRERHADYMKRTQAFRDEKEAAIQEARETAKNAFMGIFAYTFTQFAQTVTAGKTRESFRLVLGMVAYGDELASEVLHQGIKETELLSNQDLMNVAADITLWSAERKVGMAVKIDKSISPSAPDLGMRQLNDDWYLVSISPKDINDNLKAVIEGLEKCYYNVRTKKAHFPFN